VVDISNPLNQTFDALATAPGTSAAEEVATATAGATVVKAFNTTFSGTPVEGQVAGQPLDVLIAGDDEEAKKTVTQLVRDGGLRAIDVGPLERARELEGLGFLGIALQQPLAYELPERLEAHKLGPSRLYSPERAEGSFCELRVSRFSEARSLWGRSRRFPPHTGAALLLA
jgi:hypothetical protein